MIDNINPVFNKNSSCSNEISTENQIKNPPFTHTNRATNSSLELKPKRKPRSDKGHDVKFPVTDDLKFRFRTLLKQFLFYSPGLSITQTKFNTHLLRYALQQQEIITWSLNYSDPKQYMHTKLPEAEFGYIGGLYGLADARGLSYRQTVFYMVVSALIHFERKDDFSEIVQQIKTFK